LSVNWETSEVENKMAETIRLSEKQIQKLVQANQRTQAAYAEFERQRAMLNDIIEVVLDAHRAPRESEIDLQRGVIVMPDPRSEEAEEAAPADAPGEVK